MGGLGTVVRSWRKLASGQESLIAVGPVKLAIRPGLVAVRRAIFADEQEPVFSRCVVGSAGGRDAGGLFFLILSGSLMQQCHLMRFVEPVWAYCGCSD